MRIKNKRGQSTVEYILLVTAVIGVLIVFTTNKNNGFQAQLNDTLSSVSSQIGNQTDVLERSHALSPANAATNPPPYAVNVKP